MKHSNAVVLAMHRKLGGILGTQVKARVNTLDDLARWYTPGVGAVSSCIAAGDCTVGEYTHQGRTVAVVSDGSAVLGLGNLGPEAALPVMAGKAALFKEFGDVDAFPLVLDVHTPEEIVAVVKAIAPGFGGINLEDIKAPGCFAVEKQLVRELHKPVMHDDQHGTAMVVLAGLINALRVVKKKPQNIRVVIVGAGAAGTATANLLVSYGIRDTVVVDSTSIVATSRKDLDPYKKMLAKRTNPRKLSGPLELALDGADAVIGVSGPGSLSPRHIAAMADDAIVFALANPVPEIMPEEAKRAGARVVATGRSDFPNQINNVLIFPGIFRGAFANNVMHITDAMKLHAAKALADLVVRPTPQKIIPVVFDKRVARVVADAVR